MSKVEENKIHELEVGETKYLNENLYLPTYHYFRKKGEDRKFSFYAIHPDEVNGFKNVQVKRIK